LLNLPRPIYLRASAMVCGGKLIGSNLPASSDWAQSPVFSGSAAITLMFGLIAYDRNRSIYNLAGVTNKMVAHIIW